MAMLVHQGIFPIQKQLRSPPRFASAALPAHLAASAAAVASLRAALRRWHAAIREVKECLKPTQFVGFFGE